MAEAGASSNGFNILKEIGSASNDLTRVMKLMPQWYATYEALCQKNVVTKVKLPALPGGAFCSILVRERILKDHDTTFLMS
jgi:hypothetical protein